MTEQDQTNGGAPAEPTNADREEAQRLHDDIKSRETPELIGKITEFQQAVAAEALEAGGAMLPEGLTPEIMAQASAMERRVAPRRAQPCHVLHYRRTDLRLTAPRTRETAWIGSISWPL